VPTITGFGAVLTNLSDFLDLRRPAATIIGVTAAWMVLWSFLSGASSIVSRGEAHALAGILRRVRDAFSGGCFVSRFVAGIAYGFLFGYAHGWIFEDAYGLLTRNVAVERTAFFIRLAGYAISVRSCSSAISSSTTRASESSSRTAGAQIGGLLAGARFVGRHASALLGLYALNALAFLVLVALYAVVVPGRRDRGWRCGSPWDWASRTFSGVIT